MADESDPEPTRLVVLERFLDWGQAQVVRGYLESKGIDCFLADTHAGVFDGSVMIGGFRLMVPADQVATAKLWVAQVEDGVEGDQDPPPS